MTRRYGSWAGNPKGNREDPERCVVQVSTADGWRFYQCSRKRGHGPDGAYCRQHGKMADAGRRIFIPEDKGDS